MNSISSILKINKSGKHPVYLQIADQLMALIKKGLLQSGQRLLSTRQMAELLKIHRKTVVRAYDELLAQGWLESFTGSGTFVTNNIPEINPRQFTHSQKKIVNPSLTAGFDFKAIPHLNRTLLKQNAALHLDDGFPDARLAPVEDLSRAYRTQLLTGNPYLRLGYGDPKGSGWLRQELSTYLNETRGLKTSAENILVIRGTIMGLYLISTGLLQNGDNVITAELSWASANMNFLQAGANLIKVKIDNYGIDVDEIEAICRKKTIRAVYITPHHNYPTTVILRADRRLKLLRLAERYGFFIFEDDYDYDFHYMSKPLLPLASADEAGMVIYCGSFTKTISPAFRVGYLVGPENLIEHLGKLRRIIDRQGDVMLESAMAELLRNGVIQRHLRKSLREYRERRDIFCQLLKTYLAKYITFSTPDGGMAVWAKFSSHVNLKDLAQKALQNDLYLADGTGYHSSLQSNNATRLGFASSTPAELQQCVEIIESLLKARRNKTTNPRKTN